MSESVEEIDLRRLLAAGGMTRRDEAGQEAAGGNGQLTRYHYGRDPAAADALGRRLSRDVAERVDVVLTWEASDAVLAHVLGRELGAAHTVAFDESGLAFLADALPAAASVAIVADAFRDESVLRTLVGLVSASGGVVVAACSLVATGVLDSLEPAVKRYALVEEDELDVLPGGVEDL